MLADLARGLRAAGGVISPGVNQQLAQEDSADVLARRQAEMVQVKRMYELQDQQRQESMLKASPQYQMAQQQLENDKGWRGAVGQAAGDEAKIIDAAMRYGKPELAQSIIGRREDRQARVQQARDALTQRERELEMRMEDRAATREQKAQYEKALLLLKQQGLALQGQIANGNQELRRLQILAMGDKTAQADAVKEDKQIEAQVTKATTNLKDFAPALAAAQDVNKLLSFYSPQNLPGAGYLKNTDVGKFFLDQSGKDVSASIKQLGNTVLKAMSGAAVTAPEEVRQMAATMADGRFSAEDFYIAWPKMTAWVNSNVGVAAANMNPKAKELFQARSGVNLDPLKPKYVFDREKGKLVENQGDGDKVIDFGKLP
jgi:hypothetical protein